MTNDADQETAGRIAPNIWQRLLARITPRQRDLAAVIVLTLACVLLRGPSLDRVTLNPDESQYEATASYLVATKTPFSAMPYFIPGVMGVFKLMTWIFGAYPMLEIRSFVLLICLGMAVLIYVMIRWEANRWCGLLGSLLFIHHAMYYEGLTVNREWFAGALILAGVALSLHSLRHDGARRGWLLFVSGVLCGSALWFKLQAAFMVLPVPALLAWQAIVARRPVAAVRTIGPHLMGGVLSGVGFLLPSYLNGSLGELLAYLHNSWSLYVVGNDELVRKAAGSSARFYFERFYWIQPARPLLLAAYLFAVLAAGAALTGLFGRYRRDGWLTRPVVLVFVAYLVSACFSIKLGSRFFAHYYLLMLPAVAVLIGLAVSYVTVNGRDESGARWFAVALVSLLILDRVAVFTALAPLIHAHWPGPPQITLYLIVALGIVAYWLARPLRRAGPAAVALICLEAGAMILAQQTADTPESMSHNRYRFPALVQYVDEIDRPDDRLFVWGWLPELYSLTGLESASHVTMCQFVVNDYEATPDRGTINGWWANQMMRDIEARRPRIIIDASDRSWTVTSTRVYDLESYPEFALVTLLDRQYNLTRRLDGCDVYVRREEMDPP